MAFNRKPEKQILQQHRFEEFNQNSISKLISLRSTTHWHVLADSEQLQKASWNNTLSGAPAAGPHQPGAQAFLTSTLGGPGPGPRGGSARALRLWRGAFAEGQGGQRTTGAGEAVYGNCWDYFNPQQGYQIQTIQGGRRKYKVKSLCGWGRIKGGWAEGMGLESYQS